MFRFLVQQMFIFVACSGKRFCSLGSSVCTWWDERRLPTGTRHSSCPSIIHATRQLIQNRTLYIDLISPWSDFSTNFVFAVSFFNLSFWIFAFLATDKLPNLIVYSRYDFKIDFVLIFIGPMFIVFVYLSICIPCARQLAQPDCVFNVLTLKQNANSLQNSDTWPRYSPLHFILHHFAKSIGKKKISGMIIATARRCNKLIFYTFW